MVEEKRTDAELAGEPVGYWTKVAYEAVTGFIREGLAELGFTHPQYWILRHLSKDDISADGEGLTVSELERAMSAYLRAEDDLAAEAAVLLERGWITRDDAGRLWITEAGDQARAGLKERIPAIRERIHEGVDDADYVTTLRVLRQMIRNTGRTVE